jgi:hypothetical protein
MGPFWLSMVNLCSGIGKVLPGATVANGHGITLGIVTLVSKEKNPMFKKVLLTVVLALSFFSAISLEGGAPPPACVPCPLAN